MAESKETVLAIIQQIDNAREPGSVTNRMVATVLNYLAESLIIGETVQEINSLKTRMTAAEERLDNLGITEIRDAITNLRTNLQQETTDRSSADEAIIARVAALENSLNTLLNGDVTTAIENFNEVIEFLSSVTDDETLQGLLSNINSNISTLSGRINALEANGSVGSSKIADRAVTANKIALSAVAYSHLSPELRSKIDNAEDVIIVDFWNDETPGMMKDSIDHEGQYFYQTTEKKLYVSYVDEEDLQYHFAWKENPSEDG